MMPRLLLALALCLPFAAGAQAAYPSKPITILVGSAPGGSNDVFARALSRRLQESLGQTVIVDNRPSDGGVLANSLVARAQPDGYTLVVVSSTFTTGAAIRNNLQYDAITDLKPVAMLARGPLLVTVRKDSPFKTIQDLVAAAKARPAKLNYGSSGTGSINHFATELFSEGAGIKLTHIPYKGMGPATADLLGGQIDLLVASAPSILAQVKGGRARALAVTTSGRSPIAPDLPSLEEAGYKGSAIDLWWGVLAPAKTPPALVDKLNAAINKEIQSPEMKGFFLNEGAIPAPLKPAEFADYIATEIARWKAVAKVADIKPD
ncbi:MAG TPA: tripartite tricarboxylate transporter substrate binding protein [Burkholderiaceae bacterium]|jgi:tripartite-type tricarboxylate transporter receptor subunit TctC